MSQNNSIPTTQPESDTAFKPHPSRILAAMGVEARGWGAAPDWYVESHPPYEQSRRLRDRDLNFR